MAKLPEGLEEEFVALLRARDCDGVFELLARLILSENLRVSEGALNTLVGATGMAQGGMAEPRGPGYRPH